MTRLAFPSIFCALASSTAFAQTADAPRPAPELPPDVKAYRDIQESDPEKKIAAIEKWKAEVPDSGMRGVADLSVLSTLVTRLPQQPDRARKFAAGMYKAAAGKDK